MQAADGAPSEMTDTAMSLCMPPAALARTPGPLAKPDDIAATVALPVTDDGARSNGQVIGVAGGAAMRDR